MVVGTLVMAVCSFVNLFVVYPAYMLIMPELRLSWICFRFLVPGLSEIRWAFFHRTADACKAEFLDSVLTFLLLYKYLSPLLKGGKGV